MGTFKKISLSTELLPGILIREFNRQKDDYENYIIGNHIIENDAYEVYPEGVDYLNKAGVLFYYPKNKMITAGCEFWED